MAIHKGIRIHQYLEDWLVTAKFHQVSPAYTGSGKNVSTTGLAGEFRKNQSWSQNIILNFIGYQFDLKSCRVRPTPDWWQNLQKKILTLLSLPADCI